jgi:hypothetical protein
MPWLTYFSDVGHASSNHPANCKTVDEFASKENGVGCRDRFDSDPGKDDGKDDKNT